MKNITFVSRPYFSEQGNVDDDHLYYDIFGFIQLTVLLPHAVCGLQSAACSRQSAVYSLKSAVCSLQAAVCSLQSAVCGLQSANVIHVIHHEETTLVFFRSWSRYFSSMCFSTNFQTSSCGFFVCFCLFSFDEIAFLVF